MNFLKTLWHDAEPILRHFVFAALIGLFALALRLLQMIVPGDYVDNLKRIDHVLVIVLFWLFAGSTVMLFLIRLSKSIYSASKGAEIQSTVNPSPDIGSDQQTAPEGGALGAGEPPMTNEPVQTVQAEGALAGE